MRHIFGRLFDSLWSGLATGAVVTAAILVPVMATADAAVKLENTLGVANVTAGDSDYKGEVAATSGQVVKVQLTYKNTEAPTDENKANNLRVKLTVPADAGVNQVVASTIKADNSEELKGQATVKLNQENSRLQYIPGSAVWKHNTGSREQPTITETRLNDEVVLGAQGAIVESVQAGDAYSATVSILARVVTPGVSITTESQLKGDTNKWSTNNSAKPGVTLRHIISYQNTGSTEQKQVVLRDALASKVQLVPGTTKLFNTTNPNGVVVADSIASSGVNIGNYGPNANAYITFEVMLPAADQLSCGNNELRNIGVVQPEGMSEQYASSTTTVTKDCSQANEAPKPTYNCSLLTITKGENRKITAKVDYKAENGAKLKVATFDFGDGSTPLVTDKTTAEYTYKKDEKFTVSAKLTITVNGKDEVVTSAPCAQVVDFTPTSPTAPAASTAAAGGLPNSGAGDIFGIFLGATLVGFVGHLVLTNRRATRHL